MLTILFFLVFSSFVAVLLHRWYTNPRRRTLRRFRKLKKLILKDIPYGYQAEAKALLDSSEEYLGSLLNAQERTLLVSGIRRDFGHTKKLDSDYADQISSVLEHLHEIANTLDSSAMRQLQDFSDELKTVDEVMRSG